MFRVKSIIELGKFRQPKRRKKNMVVQPEIILESQFNKIKGFYFAIILKMNNVGTNTEPLGIPTLTAQKNRIMGFNSENYKRFRQKALNLRVKLIENHNTIKIDTISRKVLSNVRKKVHSRSPLSKSMTFYC